MKKETLVQIDQNNPVTRGSTALVYKQETLEEVAEKLKGKELFKESNDRARKILSEIKSLPIKERSYSDEDVKNAFLDGWQLRDGDLPFAKAKNKWFEQLKNKQK